MTGWVLAVVLALVYFAGGFSSLLAVSWFARKRLRSMMRGALLTPPKR